MDQKDYEVQRRLNRGGHQYCSVTNMMEEAQAIRRDIEREDRSRMIEEENNVILKNQLIEAREANKKLENQNKELKEANEKLEIQIKDFRIEAKSNKKQAQISLLVAVLSLVTAVVSIILSVALK